MSITDENTVLIIGAGASVIFDMPLGAGLMAEIHTQIIAETRKLKEIAETNFDRNYVGFLRSAVDRNENIISVPIHATLYSIYSDGHRNQEFVNQKKNLEELLILLSNQTSETIDDFIVENPTYAGLTKICIAAIFFRISYIQNSNFLGLKRLDIREFQKRKRHGAVGDVYISINERNWVHLLINIVRQGIRNGKVSPKNKIKIISFNYDMILEHVLDQQFSNSETMQDKDWRDYFEIIHPHGKCEPLPEVCNDATALIKGWSDGIFVIHEEDPIVPEIVKNERKRAKNIILNSHEIFACGFSFAAPNCRLIGLDQNVIKVSRLSKEESFDRFIRFCNYDGNYGVSRMVKKLEKKRPNDHWTKIEIDEQAGTLATPLSVADWIRMGVLGELPG